MTPALEDDFTYVVRKALKGLGVAPGEAAARAGVPENEVIAFSRGRFSADTARRLAPVLNLNPAALANHPQFYPKLLADARIHRIDLPFGEERVNAWLVWTDDAAILFDTGYQAQSCAVAIDAIGPPPLHEIFITHGHVDHVGGVADFLARGMVPKGAMISGAKSISAGDSFRCGSLTVRACDLSGHANPALGYFIEGLGRAVLVTGDALFSGSIGGCANPSLYQNALRHLRDALGGLPDDAVLLPGHGPATTLGEERAGNPFL